MTTPSNAAAPTVLRAAESAPRLTFDAYYELVSFYARYAAVLDQGEKLVDQLELPTELANVRQRPRAGPA